MACELQKINAICIVSIFVLILLMNYFDFDDLQFNWNKSEVKIAKKSIVIEKQDGSNFHELILIYIVVNSRKCIEFILLSLSQIYPTNFACETDFMRNPRKKTNILFHTICNKRKVAVFVLRNNYFWLF